MRGLSARLNSIDDRAIRRLVRAIRCLRPDFCVMLDIVVKGLGAEVRAYARRIVE